MSESYALKRCNAYMRSGLDGAFMNGSATGPSVELVHGRTGRAPLAQSEMLPSNLETNIGADPTYQSIEVAVYSSRCK